MRYAIGLGLFLFLLWLALSGHYTPLTLGFGVFSVILVTAVSTRMALVDRETHPVRLSRRSLAYWPWLAWQVVRSNLAVTRAILSREMNLSPVFVRVAAGQRSLLGRATYANSITLTPGTVSVDVADDSILVHALRREWAEELQRGEMDRRVRTWEGSA